MGIRRAAQPLTDKQIPDSIARDEEVAGADTKAIADHEGKANPHPQYVLPVTIVQQSVAPPAQISILANTWFDLGVLGNLNPGDSEALFAMTIYIQYIVNGTTQTYWQYAGAALISPIWWKASGAQLVKYVDIESHAQADFTLSFRLGLSGQGSRMVQLLFPNSIIARIIRASFVRLR